MENTTPNATPHPATRPLVASRPPEAAPAAAPRSGGRRYTTISIPQQLYEDVKKAIDGTGFRSPTEYLVYITRLSLQAPAEAGAAGGPFAPRPRTVPFR